MTIKVDEYLKKHIAWQTQLAALRKLLVELPLDETLKWGGPCYTRDGKNIVGIGAFKNHLTLWFYQGALLKDPRDALINAQTDKTKAMRQWRFSQTEKIPLTAVKKYVREAIKNRNLGLEIKPDRSKLLVIPDELSQFLKKNKVVELAFKQLTLSKQREYADHISEAKREQTRARRIEKIAPLILAGTALYEKYR